MARKRQFPLWVVNTIQISAALFVGVVIIAFLVAAFSKDNERQAFVEACKTMGGVPLVGSYSTRACFKPEVLK